MFGGFKIPRIKLEEQQEYKFKFNRTVQKEDLNYAGHLGNDSLISIIQEARVQLFKELGYSELDLGDGKTGIIIGDLAVNFKAEGFPNEELKIESQINEVTDKSIRVFHRVTKTNDNEIIALVETGLIAFDYGKREVTIWPDEYKSKLLRK